VTQSPSIYSLLDACAWRPGSKTTFLTEEKKRKKRRKMGIPETGGDYVAPGKNWEAESKNASV
jgi:hypothetical protein